MKNDKLFSAVLALNCIAQLVDEATLTKIKPYMDRIEDALKEITEEMSK